MRMASSGTKFRGFFSLAFVLATLMTPAAEGNTFAPPSFYDPGLQSCFDEHRAAHGWQRLEDVRVLSCPGRHIVSLSGLDQLTHLEELDLSDNFLQFATELRWLTQLEKLNLSGNRGIDAWDLAMILDELQELTHLGLRDIPIDTLDILGRDPNTWLPYPLVELDLANTGVRQLYQLEEFTSLEVLNLADNGIPDLYGIHKLDGLRSVDLSNNRLQSFWPWPQWTELTELRLSGNYNLDVQDVERLVLFNFGLTHLTLGGLDLRWAPWLAYLADGNTGAPYALVELDLSDTGFSDIETLVVYPTLRSLNLSRNGIADIELLRMFPELTELDLSENRIREVALGLGLLTKLTKLDLSGNPAIDTYHLPTITYANPDLTHLGLGDVSLGSNYLDLRLVPSDDGYFKLVELKLRNTGLEYVDELWRYNKLEVLDLSENQITDVAVLGYLRELSDVDISDNRIRNFYFLNDLPNLSRLDIGGNPALDLSALFNTMIDLPLTHIGLRGAQLDSAQLVYFELGYYIFGNHLLSLDLTDTGIRDIGPLAAYQFLEELELAGNGITDLSPLAGLDRLRKLNLEDNRLEDPYLTMFPLEDLTTLRELRLGGNEGLVLTGELIDVIENNVLLERLGLADLPIGDLSLISLIEPATFRPGHTLVELDLARTGISNVDPLLVQRSLRELDLSGNDLPQADIFPLAHFRLKSLDVSDNPRFNIGGLNLTTTLTHLDISGIAPPTVSDLNFVLAQNLGLKRLGLRDLPIYYLDHLFLEDWDTRVPYDLVELDVTNTQISDFFALRNFPTLEILAAGENPIASYDFFQTPRLKKLDLHDTALENVYIQDVGRLTHLDVSGTRLYYQVYELLIYNPGLTHVYINDLTIDVADTLRGLESPGDLEALGVSNTGLADIDFLYDFPYLRELDLSRNQIADIAVLDLLRGLSRLDVSDNAVTTLGGIFNLERLTHLDLSGNTGLSVYEISSVLDFNPGLTHLALRDILIFDLERITDFGTSASKLESLDLSNTRLTDISRLGWLVGLRFLSLRNNPFYSLSPLFHLDLRALDLRDNKRIQCSEIEQLEQELGQGVIQWPVRCLDSPPTVSILAPPNGATVASTDAVLLQGVASDEEDGSLNALIEWSSSRDGVIGTGNLFTVVLSPGSHTITAKVYDSELQLAQDTVSVWVQPGPDTIPPGAIGNLSASPGDVSVTLTWNAPGGSGALGTAARYDLRYGSGPFSFDDGIPVAGLPAPQPGGLAESFTVTGLGRGLSYTFALRAVDAAGLVGPDTFVVAHTQPGLVLFGDDLESGSLQWTVSGADGNGGGALWHLASDGSGNTAFYYGRDDTGTYDTGAPNVGAITSIAIDSSGHRSPELSFRQFFETEADLSRDRIEVLVSNNGGASWVPVVTRATSTFGALGAFIVQSADLSPFENERIRLRFQFDSVDASENAFAGWWVDDVQLTVETQLGVPEAHPGGPYIGFRNRPVMFDGSSSFDPDSATLSYAWSFGDAATSTAESPEHAYAEIGTYPVTLVVHDGAMASPPVTSSVSIRNLVPNANPGGPYTAFRNESIAFAGTASSDGDGDPLTYAWDFGDETTGSGVSPMHAYAALGDFIVTLVVHDGIESSAAVTATVSVMNQLPVANAGGPYTAVRDEAITFVGAASSDADGDPLTYAWDFGDGTAGAGEAPIHAYSTLGDFVVLLVVRDGIDSSSTSTATVSITNRAPLAVAGPVQAVELGGSVTLDASGSSDPEGDALSFAWSDSSGAIVGTSAIVTLSLPLGAHAFSLTVEDAFGASSSDVTHVDVQDTTPPSVTAALSESDPVAIGTPVEVSWNVSDLGAISGFDVLFAPRSGAVFEFVNGCIGLPADARNCTWASDTSTSRGVLRVVARDASGNVGASDTTVRIFTTLSVRVSESADDAEEEGSGKMKLKDRGLDLGSRWVGTRFQNLTLPQGATILQSYIELEAERDDGAATTLTIVGESSDHAPGFTKSKRDISSRTRTGAAVAWAPEAWKKSERYQTPDLSSVVQEVVRRTGWTSGNALVLVFSKGRGKRKARGFDDRAEKAPVLYIEYYETP